MENIIRTAVTATMDTIEAAEGYILVNMREGELPSVCEKIYIKKDAEPAFFTTMTQEEFDNLTIRLDYAWEKYLDKTLEVGTKVYYDGKIYEVRQEHTPLIIWTPNLVPALYRLSSLAEGTEEQPIPWENGMTCFNGKYYVFNDKIYYGLRDSVDPLYYNPTDLLGNYFNEVTGINGADPEGSDGSLSNPYDWVIGMVSEQGKYYTSGGVTYLCIRDSGTPLYFEPSALLGNYFEVAA